MAGETLTCALRDDGCVYVAEGDAEAQPYSRLRWAEHREDIAQCEVEKLRVLEEHDLTMPCGLASRLIVAEVARFKDAYSHESGAGTEQEAQSA